jgi:uncharacterized phage-associated protein
VQPGPDLPSAHDVAAFLIERRGPITATRLQIALYYAQAWTTVWSEPSRPLFHEPIEAWWGRPVVVSVYEAYQGVFKIETPVRGDPEALDVRQQADVLFSFDRYNHLDTQALHDLVRSEDPWRDARKGLGDQKKGPVITAEALRSFYNEVCGEGGGWEEE